jgi:hypothetical protein
MALQSSKRTRSATSPINDHPKTARLNVLPTEILHEIFWMSLKLALIYTSHRLCKDLPSYQGITKRMAVLAVTGWTSDGQSAVKRCALQAYNIPEVGLVIHDDQTFSMPRF